MSLLRSGFCDGVLLSWGVARLAARATPVLFWRLALRFGTWAAGPQVFVERFDPGVAIKRIASLSERDRERLIREATQIYEAVSRLRSPKGRERNGEKLCK